MYLRQRQKKELHDEDARRRRYYYYYYYYYYYDLRVVHLNFHKIVEREERRKFLRNASSDPEVVCFRLEVVVRWWTKTCDFFFFFFFRILASSYTEIEDTFTIFCFVIKKRFLIFLIKS